MAMPPCIVAVIPGGDPTVAAWVLAALFIAAGVACLLGAAAARGTAATRGHQQPLVWVAIGVLCLGLGLNKQLDLHRVIGRQVADLLGIAGFGAGLAVALAVLGIVGLLAVLSLTRAAWQTQWPAIVGAGLLGALALTHVHDGRAASSLLSGVAEWCAVGLIGAAAVTGRVLVARARRREVMAAARWQVVVGLVADEAADAPIPIFRGERRGALENAPESGSV